MAKYHSRKRGRHSKSRTKRQHGGMVQHGGDDWGIGDISLGGTIFNGDKMMTGALCIVFFTGIGLLYGLT
jgi:hypothetical protein